MVNGYGQRRGLGPRFLPKINQVQCHYRSDANGLIDDAFRMLRQSSVSLLNEGNTSDGAKTDTHCTRFYLVLIERPPDIALASGRVYSNR